MNYGDPHGDEPFLEAERYRRELERQDARADQRDEPVDEEYNNESGAS